MPSSTRSHRCISTFSAGSTGCIRPRCPTCRRCTSSATPTLQRDGYFHVELMSIRRSADKLKYLASSESAMEAFINDVTPESVAGALREL